MKFLLALLYAIALSVGLARRGFRCAAAPVTSPATPNPKRVLIVGATGGTGRHLVAQALERGYIVTALARNPSALRIEHPRLRVVRGDVFEYPALEAAVRAQDAVLSALGHKRFFLPT